MENQMSEALNRIKSWLTKEEVNFGESSIPEQDNVIILNGDMQGLDALFMKSIKFYIMDEPLEIINGSAAIPNLSLGKHSLEITISYMGYNGSWTSINILMSFEFKSGSINNAEYTIIG